VVNEKNVGIFGHGGGRGKEEAPLTAILAWVDLEVGAAIESLGSKFVEQFAVQCTR
jgi:hypothetical protein